MQKPTPKSRIHSARRPLLCEPLEPRQLLSATFLNAIGFGTASPYGQDIGAIATDSAGNVYVAGSFTGTIDVDPSSGVANISTSSTFNYDMFLLKYSSAGDLLFAKTFATSGGIGLGGNNAMANDLTLDANGNILLVGSFTNTIDMDPGAGTFNLTSAGGADAVVAQFDSDGNLLWAKSFGGDGDDILSKITPDKNGGFILLGNFQNTADLDPGTGVHNATAATPWDAFVTRIDSIGNLTWSDQFTAPNDLFFANIAVDNSGSVYAAGFFRGATDFNPAAGTKMMGDDTHLLGFAAKFTPSGNLAWAKSFGKGTGNFGDAAFVYDMTLDSHNNIILAGSFGGTVDINPGAATHLLTEHQSPDAFTGYLMKLSNAGNYLWSGAFTGDSWSDSYAVMTDANDNIYLAGELNGTNTLDITGTSPNDTFTSRGQDDAFLAKYDPAGHLAWAQQMGGSGYDHGLHLAMGPANSIYVAGYFNYTAHFGPQGGGMDLTAVGNMDSFIALFSQAAAAPMVTLTPSVVNPLVGRWFNLTVAVTAGQGIPTGKIIIKDGTRTIAIGTLNANGTFTIKLRYTSHASHTLTATYQGCDDFTSTLGTLILTL